MHGACMRMCMEVCMHTCLLTTHNTELTFQLNPELEGKTRAEQAERQGFEN